MKTTAKLSVLACALTFAATPQRARAEEPTSQAPMEDRVTELYRQATAAYRNHQLAEAEKLYLEAWAQKQSYDIATNLGAVELDLKKHRDAAEYLSFALRTFPARGKQEERETIVARLALAKAEIATLRIRTNLPKADVTVNGARAGITPLVDDVFAAPGTLVVEARLDGYGPAQQTLTLKKGETREVSLTLTEVQPGRSMVGPAIAFGAGGVGLLAGIIGGGFAAAKLGELKTTCGEALVCPESVRGTYDAANGASYFSTAGFVLAGLGAATGVILLLVPDSKKARSQANLTLGPAFVGLHGSF